MKYIVYRDKNGVKRKMSINSKKVKGGALTDEQLNKLKQHLNDYTTYEDEIKETLVEVFSKIPNIETLSYDDLIELLNKKIAKIDELFFSINKRGFKNEIKKTLLKKFIETPNIETLSQNELDVIYLTKLVEIKFPNDSEIESFKIHIRNFFKINKIEDNNDMLLNSVLTSIDEKQVKTYYDTDKLFLIILQVFILVKAKETLKLNDNMIQYLANEIKYILINKDEYKIPEANNIIMNNLLFIIYYLLYIKKVIINFKHLELIIKYISDTQKIILSKDNYSKYQAAIIGYIDGKSALLDLNPDPNYEYKESIIPFYNE